MPKNKNELAYESGVNRMKEIDSNIKAIAIRSAWLVGLLVAVSIAIAGILLNASDALVFYVNGNEINVVRPAIIAFLLFQLSIIAIYSKILLKIDFGMSIYNEAKNILKMNEAINDEIKRIQKGTDYNNKILNQLTADFNALLTLFVWSLFYILFSGGMLWVLSA